MNNDYLTLPTIDYVSNNHPKLTINTALNQDGLGTTRNMSGMSAGMQSSGLMSSNSAVSGYGNLHSPVRRRNNYNTGELGPYFYQAKQDVNVWSADRSKMIRYNVCGRVDKGFFLAGSDWTCYRRNYFQVSGTFSSFAVPASMGHSDASSNDFYRTEPDLECYLELEGSLYPIIGYRMGVSSKVAASDRYIELVQHTSKRDKGPKQNPDAKPIKSGGNIMQSQLQQLLAAGNSAVGNTSVATFERLQFKCATANNGKRRAAQQYYVIQTDLFAEIEGVHGYRLIKIASAASAPLVVRGRSPGHYADIDQGHGVLHTASIVESLGSAVDMSIATPMSSRAIAPNPSRFDAMFGMKDNFMPRKSFDFGSMQSMTGALLPNHMAPLSASSKSTLLSAVSNFSLPDMLSDPNMSPSYDFYQTPYMTEKVDRSSIFEQFEKQPPMLHQPSADVYFGTMMPEQNTWNL